MSSISNLCVQIILSPQISKLTGIYIQPNISVIYPSSTDAQAVSQAQFGPGSGPTLYSNVRCYGNESSIMNISYTPGGTCTDAGVICQRRLCK